MGRSRYGTPTRATAPQTIGQLAAGVQALAISQDGTTAYAGDEHGGVSAWDLTGSRRLGRRSGSPGTGRRPSPRQRQAARCSPSPTPTPGSSSSTRKASPPPARSPSTVVLTRSRSLRTAGTAAFGTRDGSVGFADLRTGRLLGVPAPSTRPRGP